MIICILKNCFHDYNLHLPLTKRYLTKERKPGKKPFINPIHLSNLRCNDAISKYFALPIKNFSCHIEKLKISYHLKIYSGVFLI